ncbi:hypothetical protein EYF80_057224 [Liparis tanakae]|uniref:Uncharacterized protein n=1 Tax=Liparis tanakae TaxID=230148 RepID=A0A4Z2EUT7_9TELE|nr:hypothetical protein EYF80_057224 [Liparis tanakae]
MESVVPHKYTAWCVKEQRRGTFPRDVTFLSELFVNGRKKRSWLFSAQTNRREEDVAAGKFSRGRESSAAVSPAKTSGLTVSDVTAQVTARGVFNQRLPVA